MHGMICKALEGYLRGVHGPPAWREIRIAAGLEFESFETLSIYDDALFDRVIGQAVDRLAIPRDTLLEDLGTWLCTDPSMEPVRRLMRFSGATYGEFLYALEDMHERALMAVPDLNLPVVSVIEVDRGQFRVAISWHATGAGVVLMGILRAMADDYGTLAVIEVASDSEPAGGCAQTLAVSLVEADFAPARAFDLARIGVTHPVPAIGEAAR